MLQTNDSIINQILLNIEKARKPEIDFLLYSFFTSVTTETQINEVISRLRAQGIFACYFFENDPGYAPEQIMHHLYICWTEAARDEAMQRGYRFA